MKKIIQYIIGFYLLFYLIYTPIYFLFFNSAESAAEKMSVISAAQSLADLASDSGNSQEANLNQQAVNRTKDFAKTCEKQYDIDITTPLYKQLKKDKDITNVTLRNIGSQGGLRLFSLQFDMDRKSRSIDIFVREPSFLKVQTAKAFVKPNAMGPILSLYGLGHKAINNFDRIWSF